MLSTSNCYWVSHRMRSVFCLNSLYVCLSLNVDKGIMSPQWTHVAKMTSLWRQNDVVWRHNNVIIVSCAPWVPFTLLWTNMCAVSRFNKWVVLYVTNLLYTPVLLLCNRRTASHKIYHPFSEIFSKYISYIAVVCYLVGILTRFSKLLSVNSTHRPSAYLKPC